MNYKWRPSKSKAKEFAKLMDEIDEFCTKNNISNEEDTVYIHASKTRIIQIYNDLKDGYELDGRGNRK